MTRKLETTQHDEHKTLVQRALAPSSLPLMLAFVNSVFLDEVWRARSARQTSSFPLGGEGKRALAALEKMGMTDIFWGWGGMASNRRKII
ncbi:MAG TPA: hypothetical protein VHD63_15610, partial [Ktedonobacteraceae bacterium]|nr:hypothetical protein [Ktedonobacteraceae bacterium]